MPENTMPEMFLASRMETKEQIENAQHVFEVLSKFVESYKTVDRSEK